MFAFCINITWRRSFKSDLLNYFSAPRCPKEGSHRIHMSGLEGSSNKVSKCIFESGFHKTIIPQYRFYFEGAINKKKTVNMDRPNVNFTQKIVYLVTMWFEMQHFPISVWGSWVKYLKLTKKISCIFCNFYWQNNCFWKRNKIMNNKSGYFLWMTKTVPWLIN